MYKGAFPMKLLILSGSAFPDSHTHSIARLIESLVEQPEHEVTHIDLREKDIPIFGQGEDGGYRIFETACGKCGCHYHRYAELSYFIFRSVEECIGPPVDR